MHVPFGADVYFLFLSLFFFPFHLFLKNLKFVSCWEIIQNEIYKCDEKNIYKAIRRTLSLSTGWVMLLVSIPKWNESKKKRGKNIKEFARRWTRQLVHRVAQCWQPRIFLSQTFTAHVDVCRSRVTPEVGCNKIHFHSFYRYSLPFKKNEYLNQKATAKKKHWLSNWRMLATISGHLVWAFVHFFHRFCWQLFFFASV